MNLYKIYKFYLTSGLKHSLFEMSYKYNKLLINVSSFSKYSSNVVFPKKMAFN